MICRELDHADPLTAQGHGGRVYLVCSDAIRQSLLHAFSGDSTNNKIRKARFKANEEIQDGNLKRIVCTELSIA